MTELTAATGLPFGAPPGIYRDIEAALKKGDIDAATALSRRALDSGLRHPMLFDLRAYWHECEGRYAEACADLEEALALAPGDPKLLNLLGSCRTKHGELVAGVSACREAIAADPTYAAAHYNEGFALEQLAELELAWNAYRRAVTLAPAMADASARLAGLAARRGDNAEARDWANRALAIDATNRTAQLAHVAVDLAEKNFESAGQRARAVAADPASGQQVRASAENYLADALDGLGRPAEAFEAYRRANDILSKEFEIRFRGVERGRTLAQRLAREFEAVEPDGWGPIAPAPLGGAAGLIFLMGFPRSGTTLLGQILGSHSSVETILEKPLLGPALDDFVNQPGGFGRLAALSPSKVAQHRRTFLERVRNEGVDMTGKYIVDQTPLNTLHMPVITKLFPEAKIVFALRDPRDVVFSCFRRLFAPNPYVYEFLSLDGAAHFYDEVMSLASRYRATLGPTLIDVRNEDVIADFEGQCRALCSFLNITYSENMRNFAARAERSARIATPSATQVARGITGDGVGQWRRYERQMAPLMPILTPWVRKFGYL